MNTATIVAFKQVTSRTTLALTLVAICLVMSFGCGSKKADPLLETKEMDDQTTMNVESLSGLARISSYTEPTLVEKGLAIHARAEGGSLIVSVRNKSTADISILPRDFGIIKGPDRQKDLVILIPQNADLKMFPAQILKPNDHWVFRAELLTIGSAAGMRLVYNNPREEILFLVPIEG